MSKKPTSKPKVTVPPAKPGKPLPKAKSMYAKMNGKKGSKSC